MIAGRIQGQTRVLGRPRDWDEGRQGPCGGLPIRDERLHGGTPAMVSAWLPTADEIAAIVAGAPIILTVCGQVHPPVALGVGEPPEAVG